jgi:hypothetical protein
MAALHTLPCTKHTRLSPGQVQPLEGLLDYVFDHKCYHDDATETPGSGSNPDGNRRLALVGDALLRLVMIINGNKRGYTPGEATDLTLM